MKFPKWMKKSLIILISVLTFGMVTPSELHWLEEASANKNTNKKSVEESKNVGDGKQHSFSSYHHITKDQVILTMIEKAENTSYIKFGEKIAPKIQDEFKDVILPKMEEAISDVTANYNDRELSQLAISEKPAGGTGEKIFHIYNMVSGEDIIRFHVRRENPPQQGHWFNFHYHLSKDGFVKHHDLGKIYWDKNTPPKWGAGTLH
ncbi:YpjP family protein [Peribacillus acanthi]|uniref:YpjP family protein n=1 Tax=Peribacillus acanthi TaxID=2171554 RepID=UPI000D3E15A1|nr:YpjP family protein [Peribacillus acanthi]